MIIGISGRSKSGKDLIGQIIQYLIAYKKYNETDSHIEDDLKGGFRLNADYTDVSNWKIVKFADKLKDIVCLLIGCTRNDLEGQEFKAKELGEEWWYYVNSEMGFKELIPYSKDGYDLNKYRGLILYKLTPRLLLQRIGTDLFRNQLHPNCWINATLANYKPVDNRTWQDPDDSNVNYPFWCITDVRFPNEAKAIKQRDGILIRVNRPCDECGLLSGAHKMDCSKDVIEHESETALDYYKFDYVIDNDGSIDDLIVKVKEILVKEKII